MPEQWDVRSSEQFANMVEFFSKHDFTEKPVKFEVKNITGRISKQARGLYWGLWLPAMVAKFHDYLEGRTPDEKKDDMHDLLRHVLLGYVEKTIGQTVLKPRLKSTCDKDMDSTAFCHYMSKVDAWAADHSVRLPRPEDNEYQLWIDAQER